MLTKYLLPLLAVLGIALAVFTVRAQNKPVIPAAPVAQPAAAPYEANVPGAGLVEPSTENISIGTQIAGVVTKVFVKAGDRVKAGDPLFMIDDRSMRSELAIRQAAVSIMQSQLQRMESLPRPEEVPAMEARLKEQESMAEDAKNQLGMYEKLPDMRAVSADELSKRRYAVSTANARVAQAKSDLELLKAGAWKPELEIARANLTSAKADMERTQTDLDRLTVKAPVDADILKVNIRPGEFAPAGLTGDPLMTIGDTRILHIRVDVDENDAWRVKRGAPGWAYVRGNTNLKTQIQFVRFEPYVIPKKSLTGASGERVDTRVLQVIYSFENDPDKLLVYVGQQMDVFISGTPIADAKFGVDAGQADKDIKGARQ